jgi:hypothetical protein
MGRQFHPELGAWGTYGPSKWQAGLCFPTPVATDMRGRIELVIGRLGAGKTTWAALRAQRLARVTDRLLCTNGHDWPAPWNTIDSFEAMEDLRDVVFVWDEIHLMLPSSKGLLGRDEERFLIRWLSLCRKRGIDVIGTTQAWTRCATHYRQLVTTVWIADALTRGKLHRAIGFDPPEDGGRQAASPQFYGPAAAAIPTHASVWTGFEVDDVEGSSLFGTVESAASVRLRTTSEKAKGPARSGANPSNRNGVTAPWRTL